MSEELVGNDGIEVIKNYALSLGKDGSVKIIINEHGGVIFPADLIELIKSSLDEKKDLPVEKKDISIDYNGGNNVFLKINRKDKSELNLDLIEFFEKIDSKKKEIRQGPVEDFKEKVDKIISSGGKN